MTTVLLRKTKLEEWQRLEAPVQRAEAVLRSSAAEQLQRVAAFVETGQPVKSNDLETTSRHGIMQLLKSQRMIVPAWGVVLPSKSSFLQVAMKTSR